MRACRETYLVQTRFPRTMSCSASSWLGDISMSLRWGCCAYEFTEKHGTSPMLPDHKNSKTPAVLLGDGWVVEVYAKFRQWQRVVLEESNVLIDVKELFILKSGIEVLVIIRGCPVQSPSHRCRHRSPRGEWPDWSHQQEDGRATPGSWGSKEQPDP